MCDQSGSLRAADDTASVGGNNLCSSSASSISSGIGQLRPATAARRTYSPTAVLPIPVASPTSRRLIPIACVRRSTSRIFFIDNLSAGIGFPLVARETDHLFRLSTGVLSTPPSPAVRNHRITVRVAPVSALATRTDALSPRMLRVIEELAGDWRWLDQRIDGLSGEIEALARQDQACSRLMTVPGIGPIISSAMRSAE